MTIVHASFIVFDIPISPTFKEDDFLTESSWLGEILLVEIYIVRPDKPVILNKL